MRYVVTVFSCQLSYKSKTVLKNKIYLNVETVKKDLEDLEAPCNCSDFIWPALSLSCLHGLSCVFLEHRSHTTVNIRTKSLLLFYLVLQVAGHVCLFTFTNMKQRHTRLLCIMFKLTFDPLSEHS